MIITKIRTELLLEDSLPHELFFMNPRTVLGSGWWDKERKKAYAAFNYRCYACGADMVEREKMNPGRKYLEAHEKYDIDFENGLYRLKEIVALCNFCHSFIHTGYLGVKVSKGIVTQEMAFEIIKRGNNNLEAYGLDKKKFLDEKREKHIRYMKESNSSYYFMVVGDKKYNAFYPDGVDIDFKQTGEEMEKVGYSDKWRDKF